MGNLVGFTKPGKVSVRQVWEVLPDILKARFPDCFDVIPLLGTGIHIICRDCPDLQWGWWQDGNRVWGKYPHYGFVADWVHASLLHDVGSRIGCKLVSEGSLETWLPEAGKHPTLKDFFMSRSALVPGTERAVRLGEVWLDIVKQIPAVLLPFAGDTGPL